MKTILPESYAAFLDELKQRIRSAQMQAALSVNRELLVLYWDIGRRIVEKQRREKWGARIIARLAADLERAFPGTDGFSRTNLYRMRAFFLAWPEETSIVPQPVGQLQTPRLPAPVLSLPWGHNTILLEKLKSSADRLWYAQAALDHGWSRDVLALQIESRLRHRQGRAVTNFRRTLPAPQSDLAQQALKDPYVFGFLTVAESARERDIENQLMDHVTRFLIELGAGFAFVGRQVHIEVAGEDFYLDLLFYHTRLHCYVVVDLKMGAFKAEDAGKMNFYLSAVDERMRQPEDHPTIGLLLCRTRNRLVAEYALRDLHKPIGVATWQARLTRSLPRNLQPSLPSVAAIEKELGSLTGRPTNPGSKT